MDSLKLESWKLRAQEMTFAELMARTLRSKPMLRRVEMQFAKTPDGIALCQKELNVLINVALTCLGSMPDTPDYGSLRVCTQEPEGGEVVYLLRADLGSGVSCLRDATAAAEVASDVEVEHLVADVVKHGCKVSQKAMRKLELPMDDYLESRIYGDADWIDTVLVANSDQGRYIAAFVGCRLVNGALLHAVIMQTLACLRREDAMLQESAALVEVGLREGGLDVAVQLMQDVRAVFASKTEAILQEWIIWRREIDLERGEG